MTNTQALAAGELAKNYTTIQELLARAALRAGRSADSVRLIAVTKTHPASTVEAALQAGMTCFGENYVQELREKLDYFAASPPVQQPKWHFIGHLQKNKVRYIAADITMIHSVDSPELAREIDKQARKHNRVIDVLLQVNTSGEESKFGCSPHDVVALAEQVVLLPNIRVRGLMTIAAFADDPEVTRPMFRLLRTLRDDLQNRFAEVSFHELSMGMTNDFETAIEEGATLIRIGTAIFGSRPQKER